MSFIMVNRIVFAGKKLLFGAKEKSYRADNYHTAENQTMVHVGIH